jgi:competence protein ComEC
MPMGILGVLALPFGFDGFFWRLMAAGLDWMIAVALWVTSLPGAVGRITAFSTGPLLLGSAGLVTLGLLKTPLRLTGAGVLIAACVWALRTPQPDVLVAGDGGSFAVRSNGDRLAFVKAGSDTFAFREWLAADADPRQPKDKTLGQGVSCDDAGCVGRLADGAVVAISRTAEAFEDDCRRAALIVTPREAPPDCAAVVVDRTVWQAAGSVALRRVGSSWEVTMARPPGYDRPWARATPETGRKPTANRLPADATPNLDAVEPADQ